MSSQPTRLGKYEIVRALGEGAMGVVYEAVDNVIERTVAIKTIRKADLDPDEAAEHSRRFLVEAKAAGKLNHPHIIGLYDYGDEAGLAYIVMELVQGRELQRYFDERFAFSLGDTVRLMGELLDALGYSHRRGVIHRDIKPANIFVTEAGGIKLGDFGIARIESTQKTKIGAVLGTPSYMSPEQIRGEQADARSDLYAAGVVLFQFLTGERPFTGTMLTMALKVLNEPAPAASSIAPTVSPALDAVVTKALAKDARARYQSAAEFWRALAEATGLVVAPSPSLAVLGDAANAVGERTRSLFSGTGLGTVSGFGADAAAPAASPPAPAPTAPQPAATGAAASLPEARAPVTAVRPQPAGRRHAVLAATGFAALALAIGAWWWFGRSAPSATQHPQNTVIGLPPAASVPVPSVPAIAPPPAAPAASIAAEAASAGQAPPAASARASPAPPTAPASAVSAPPREAIEPAAPAPPPARRVPREPRAAPAPPPAVAAPPAVNPTPRAAKPARCSDILQKASLEPLSAEEAAYLRRECQ